MLEELSERTDRIESVKAELDPGWTAADVLRFVDLDIGDQHGVRWGDEAGTMAGTLHVQGYSLRVDPYRWTVDLSLWAYAGNGLEPEPVGPAAFTWGMTQWGVHVWGPG